MEVPFFSADILLPKALDGGWPVIACDQFTSEPSYWEKAASLASSPSALDLILPEVYLGESEARVKKINSNMRSCLENGVFEEYPDSMIAVFRTLPSGKVRRGVVGMIPLDEYGGLVLPTEATVPERVPPRVKIRKGALLELPHILLFLDDPGFTAFPSGEGKELYSLPLMLGGGSVTGKLMTEKEKETFLSVCASLTEKNGFTFAIGDGNHSLAAAKASGSSYALVEVVNLRDEAIVFEPIYRLIKGVSPDEVALKAKEFFTSGDSSVTLISGNGSLTLPLGGLPVKAVDEFVSSLGCEVDYIHGEENLRSLSTGSNVGFLFEGIKKEDLFPYIRENGALPRKTFSMGTAYEKRYYLEAMRIK
ncbi:MAG: DUF1015 family protein [Firmicutes bacterium]|nr:DUF1015 family protein [Candidatus Colimorpha enterica]